LPPSNVIAQEIIGDPEAARAATQEAGNAVDMLILGSQGQMERAHLAPNRVENGRSVPRGIAQGRAQ
jgi:hypothetical protein